MTTFRTNLGGAAPPAGEPGVGAAQPGGMSERWREKYKDYATRGPAIDWDSAEYATPKPSPKQTFGRRGSVAPDVPDLPEAMVRVRSKPPAVYYDVHGNPIPANWTLVPVSPGLLDAVKSGDLEQDKSYRDEPAQQSQQQRRRHTTQTTPSS